MTAKRVPYPTKAQILRLIEAAKAAGIVIGAIRVSPTGDVTVLDKSVTPAKDEPDFSEYV